MAEQILDGYQIRIGIQQLGGHRVPQLMTGYIYSASFGIMLDAFLYTTYRDGLSSTPPFLDQEYVLRPGRRPSDSQVFRQGRRGIMTHINDPVLAAFAVINNQSTLAIINGEFRS